MFKIFLSHLTTTPSHFFDGVLDELEAFLVLSLHEDEGGRRRRSKEGAVT